jgi:hypothetical protein
MGDSFWLDWTLRTGRAPTELMQMIDDEPEPIRNRFWIYVNPLQTQMTLCYQYGEKRR